MTRQIDHIEEPQAIDREWLETDISHLEEYEHYDWGDLDPLTLGKPVEYVSGIGFVVEGGKANA